MKKLTDLTKGSIISQANSGGDKIRIRKCNPSFASKWILLFTVAAIGTACGGRDNPVVPEDPNSLEFQIRALYPGDASAAPLAQLATIRERLAAGANQNAQSLATLLVGSILTSFKAGTLSGGVSASTGNSVSKVVDGLYQLVGLDPPKIPDNTLGGDGAAEVLGPQGGQVVTPTGAAGAQIPAGAFTEPTLVTVTRIANTTTPGTGPLATNLAQYPPYYEYQTFPKVPQFGDSVRVGVCQVSDPSSPFFPPEATHDRLRLAHTVGATIEILERVGVSDFLRCSGTTASSIPNASGTLSRWGMRVLAFVERAANLGKPAELYAAHGGLGGKVKSFSPFGAVDPGTAPKLAATSASACVLTTQGETFCWGDVIGPFGPLGVPKQPVLSPQRVATSVTFKSLSGGLSTMCGLTAAKALYCWGDNSDGQYGYGSSDTVSSALPRRAVPDLALASFGVGQFAACGVTLSGDSYCWGGNGVGALGDGTTGGRKTPVRVIGQSRFTIISPGANHTCALSLTREVSCWGWNFLGQLGNGSTTTSGTPSPITGSLRFVKLDAQRGDHSCGIATDGGAYCWGINGTGELGTPTTTTCSGNPCSPVPVKVASTVAFTEIYSGDGLTCALTATGAAYCWGDNSFGGVGNGTASNTPVFTPTAVTGGITFTALAVGYLFACGSSVDGKVYCWGANFSGQIGQGTSTSFYATPQLVPGVTVP